MAGDPLGGVGDWVIEQITDMADDALVDGLVKAGDVTAADAVVLKRAGPIYVKALLNAWKNSAKPAPSS